LPRPQQADNRHDEKDQKAQQGYPLYDFQQSLGGRIIY
jgi:predicted lipoprotein with Yx(FWY)xxD motif